MQKFPSKLTLLTQKYVVFSEHELTFTFAIYYRPSVCRLSSLTFVRRTQAVQIFGNISTVLRTLTIHWHPPKSLRRSSQGNPSAGGVIFQINSSIAISDLSTAISRKRWNIAGKLVITNRKWYMSFRLVPKSVTFNELERRNVDILRYFSEFGWVGWMSQLLAHILLSAQSAITLSFKSILALL